MLGRKREDQKDGPGSKKRKKWQEDSDDDEGPAELTIEEMEEWKAKMEEEEKQEERERQRREREARDEAERRERERQRRREEEERERRELEEQMEEEERERQAARREAAERAAEEVKRLWDKPPAEAPAAPVILPSIPLAVASIPSGPPVPAPAPLAAMAAAPKTLSALMQAQAAGANIAATLMAAQPVMAAMGGGGEEAPGDVTLHVHVPAMRVKDLLGVQGRNIKALKSQTGVAKVGVLDRNDPATVEIVGAPSAVEKCKALINSIMEGDLAAIGNVTETLDIETRLVSRLIGPRGQNISSMKDQSGAYLAVREPSPGMGNKVVIIGFPECVARARELVVNFLNHEGNMANMAHAGNMGNMGHMGHMGPAAFGMAHAAPGPTMRPMQSQVPSGWTHPGLGKGAFGGKAPDMGAWAQGKGACDAGWHEGAWQGDGGQWGQGCQGAEWGHPPAGCGQQYGQGQGRETWPEESWDYGGNGAASGAAHAGAPHPHAGAPHPHASAPHPHAGAPHPHAASQVAGDYGGPVHQHHGREDYGDYGDGFDPHLKGCGKGGATDGWSQATSTQVAGDYGGAAHHGNEGYGDYGDPRAKGTGKGGATDGWRHAAANQENWHGYNQDQQRGAHAAGWGHWPAQGDWDERWGAEGPNGSGPVMQRGAPAAAAMHHAAYGAHDHAAYGAQDQAGYGQGHHPDWGSHM